MYSTPNHLTNVLQNGLHPGGFSRSIQTEIVNHLEMLGRNVAHHAMNELQNGPSLLVPKLFMRLVEKGHTLTIVGQYASICNGWVTNVTSNITADTPSVFNARFGMDVEACPVGHKQVVY